MTSAIIQKTARLLKKIHFGTLATCADSIPWAAPVSYAISPDFELIYISSTNTLHAKHNTENPHACFAVYDTETDPTAFDWVKMVGNVRLAGKHELEGLLDLYFERRYPYDPDLRKEERIPSERFGADIECFVFSVKEVYTMDLLADEADASRRVMVDVGDLRDALRITG